MEEIWKSVSGYEGLYEISSLGRVKSLHFKKPHIVGTRRRGGPNNDDYWVVELTRNKSQNQYAIHRLIAIAFIYNPENKPQVNHKDGVKTNNAISNLEWNTVSENTKHAYDTGLFVNPKRKIVLDTYTGIFYESLDAAAKAKGVGSNYIMRCFAGKRSNKTPRGLIYV